jgi:hypothetical protein
MPFDGDLKIKVSQSSEYDYDYGILSKIGQELENAYTDDSSNDDTSAVKYTAKGLNGEDTVTYESISEGNHSITVKYYKDVDESKNNDTFKIISMIATPK